VKVTAVEPVDDQTVNITYRQGTGTARTVAVDYLNLLNYNFVPETQLFCTSGAIKKNFATYVHDYPSTILSQERRDEIQAFVLARQPWI
jgi:hypothetical protein